MPARKCVFVPLGGEEFLVLLPGFDATVVRSMAETVRGKVADKAFKPGIELRASFGAGVLDAGLSLDKNLTLIDNALTPLRSVGVIRLLWLGIRALIRAILVNPSNHGSALARVRFAESAPFV